MLAFLELLAAIAGGFVVTGAVGIGIVARWSGQRNRVDPAVRSPAPRWWAVAPGRAPHLHRRLRRASLLVLASTGPSRPAGRRSRRRDTDAGSLASAGREVVARAVRLDERLVAVDRGTRTWRSRQLRDLSREVAQLESAAVRIAELAERLRTHVERVTAPVGGPDPLAPDEYEAALGDLGVQPPGP